MLTKVYLDGVMGQKFGEEWELECNSPNEALKIIDANIPGVFTWIRENLDVYSRYRVVCEFENGRSEELDDESYRLERKVISIRFVPVIAGSGAVGRFVAGAVLVIAGAVTEQPWMIKVGATMMIGGVIGMLTSQPHLRQQEQTERKDKTSYYFDGPINTTGQGVPVPLIYGRVLVGSHAISAAVTIDQ